MSLRDINARPAASDLMLRGPPNWTAAGFFAALAFLHLSIAIPAFLAHRWEGHLSLVLGLAFLAAGAVAIRFRFEITFLAATRLVRLRTGIGRICVERFIPFSAVHAVRVTLAESHHGSDSRIELLCRYDDIECPPTDIPRQQALFLAILLDVPLIKVWSAPATPARPVASNRSTGPAAA